MLKRRENHKIELLTKSEEPIRLVSQIEGMQVWEATNEAGESLHVGVPDWKVEAEELDTEGVWFTFHWEGKKFVVDDIFDEE